MPILFFYSAYNPSSNIPDAESPSHMTRIHSFDLDVPAKGASSYLSIRDNFYLLGFLFESVFFKKQSFISYNILLKH